MPPSLANLPADVLAIIDAKLRVTHNVVVLHIIGDVTVEATVEIDDRAAARRVRALVARVLVDALGFEASEVRFALPGHSSEVFHAGKARRHDAAGNVTPHALVDAMRARADLENVVRLTHLGAVAFGVTLPAASWRCAFRAASKASARRGGAQARAV